METWLQLDTWIALLTLSSLEIVLGIDNLIFISILAGRLPEAERERARRVGLGGALVTRLALLLGISWIVGLTQPWFAIGSFEVTGKSLVLLAGGLFLLFKATREIHHKVEGDIEGPEMGAAKAVSFGGVIAQIMVLDVVFSLDSVITAVGMSNSVQIMVVANLIALGIMLAVGGVVSRFVDRHPTVKVLALSFLLMVGLVLVADGLGFHIPKGYVYFAMGFSVLVEFLNLRMAKKTHVKRV